jgi:S1-C subfamily serine protease
MADAKFILDSGLEVDGGKSIVPLIGMKSNDAPEFLGTAFFISPTGAIIVTAKHCLFEKEGKPWKDLAIVQFVEDHKFVVRGIRQWYWNQSDVAILVPHPMTKKNTPGYVENPVPTLTLEYPPKGTHIASFAYPQSTLDVIANKQAKIRINDSWHYGQIEGFHQEGVSLLRNPCFQSSMEIRGGSSGGPVANLSGHIFAINSSGAETTPEIAAYSFLSPINLCFNMQVDLTIDNQRRMYSIWELITSKFIPVHGVNC